VAVNGSQYLYYLEASTPQKIHLYDMAVKSDVTSWDVNTVKGMDTDNAGNLYYADAGTGKIIRAVLKPDKKGVTRTDLLTGLTGLSGITVNANGDIIFADGAAIKRLPADGGAVTTILTFGAAGDRPLDSDASGNILIGDGNSVKLLPADHSTRHAALNTFRLSTVFTAGTLAGFAVDGAGNLFVSDSNAQKVFELPIARTDPLNVDSDRDGLWDGYDIGVNNGELTLHILKNNAQQSFSTDPLLPDSDGDGVKDGIEIEGFTVIYQIMAGAQSVPTNSDPTVPHSDSDGLTVKSRL